MGSFADQQSISTYWFNKANELRGAAELLSDAGRSSCVFRMLCGMALEALLKAISVESGQTPRRTHNLNQLARDAGIHYATEEQKLLQILSEAIIWDGRYPVPNDERHWGELKNLKLECLLDQEPLGNSGTLTVNRPNDKLNWNSFEALRSPPFSRLCKIATWIHNS
ncbi:HEPN domain-containing protein [Rosistilla ulvae]|uniref:HEPN domain-containing protein n=1 Tax=Rosistilla ulvae TaxID=1930277 RepID=UPI001C54CA7B